MKITKIMYLIPLLVLIVSFSITQNVYAQTNTPPTINILKPTPGLYLSAISITFIAGATDPEDGAINHLIVWTSNVSGFIGNGFNITTKLPAGDHTITATVTDSGGLTSEVSVSGIKVVASNQAPVITIETPSTGDIFGNGEPVTFEGSAIDDYDGDISETMFWISNIDGNLGTGPSITTSELSVGIHTITVRAFDSFFWQGINSVTIMISDEAHPIPNPSWVNVSINESNSNWNFENQVHLRTVLTKTSEFDSSFNDEPLTVTVQTTNPDTQALLSTRTGTVTFGGLVNQGVTVYNNWHGGIEFVQFDILVTDSQNRVYSSLFSQTLTNPSYDPTIVTITSPQNNELVKGKFDVSAVLSGFEGTTTVKFMVDGITVYTDTTSPYETSLFAKDFSSGDHTLVVEASDANSFDTDSIVFRKR